MLTDAHCHPFFMIDNALAEGTGIRLPRDIAVAASGWELCQHEMHEGMARAAAGPGSAPWVLCFGCHPQQPASEGAASCRDTLDALARLAEEGRLSAVGEAGFDLYEERYRATEEAQERVFETQLDIACARGLPMVLHLRRALHKLFPYVHRLKNLPAVIFHSWPGSPDEARAILRRGINAYFALGGAVCGTRKNSRASAALLPADRLLFETDAPYQPLPGKTCSSWDELPAIRDAVAALRREAGSPRGAPQELEAAVAENFFRAYKKGLNRE
ncbi:MAG: TatD family hydrolase [Treponema sp.]|jgi:TatD DNase family protein|nr:TatD family hydrolase [Treponema sp.]